MKEDDFDGWRYNRNIKIMHNYSRIPISWSCLWVNLQNVSAFSQMEQLVMLAVWGLIEGQFSWNTLGPMALLCRDLAANSSTQSNTERLCYVTLQKNNHDRQNDFYSGCEKHIRAWLTDCDN